MSIARAPKVRHSKAQANPPSAEVNGSIKVPQPQRGVTRIQDSEFRPVGASNRLDSKTSAEGGLAWAIESHTFGAEKIQSACHTKFVR